MADINQNKPVEASKDSTTEKKQEPKAKKEKKPRREFKVVMKTWSKGLSKETSRITWEKKRDVAKDFITVLVIGVVLGLIFFAVDMIILAIRK